MAPIFPPIAADVPFGAHSELKSDVAYRTMWRNIVRLEIVDAGEQSWNDGEVGPALPITTEKGAPVILVLNQYKHIGCSPDKHPDTRTMATGSDDDNRDSVHDKYCCIAVLWSERVLRYHSRDRHRAH